MTETTEIGTTPPPGTHAATEPWILYDGECPFCSAFVRMVRLRESIGPVRLVDAREGGPELEELRARGLSIDEGMAMKLDGELYHGDDCINRLGMLSSGSNAFNKFNAWVFRSPGRSRMLYPVLRSGRNAALKVLGVKKIEGQG